MWKNGGEGCIWKGRANWVNRRKDRSHCARRFFQTKRELKNRSSQTHHFPVHYNNYLVDRRVARANGRGGEGRGEDPVKIMIENNRNRINVQSCGVEGYRGLVGNDHRFQGSVIIRLEDKHYVNDLHYPQIIEL